jgi:hypothetical protein
MVKKISLISFLPHHVCSVLACSKLESAYSTLTSKEFKEYFQLYGVTQC